VKPVSGSPDFLLGSSVFIGAAELLLREGMAGFFSIEIE
jgi:hypothetical protein